VAASVPATVVLVATGLGLAVASMMTRNGLTMEAGQLWSASACVCGMLRQECWCEEYSQNFRAPSPIRDKQKNVFATLSLRRRTSPTFSLALQGDEEDPAEEAAEEGLGIGMPATRLNQRGQQHSRYQILPDAGIRCDAVTSFLTLWYRFILTRHGKPTSPKPQNWLACHA